MNTKSDGLDLLYIVEYEKYDKPEYVNLYGVEQMFQGFIYKINDGMLIGCSDFGTLPYPYKQNSYVMARGAAKACYDPEIEFIIKLEDYDVNDMDKNGESNRMKLVALEVHYNAHVLSELYQNKETGKYYRTVLYVQKGSLIRSFFKEVNIRNLQLIVDLTNETTTNTEVNKQPKDLIEVDGDDTSDNEVDDSIINNIMREIKESTNVIDKNQINEEDLSEIPKVNNLENGKEAETEIRYKMKPNVVDIVDKNQKAMSEDMEETKRIKMVSELMDKYFENPDLYDKEQHSVNEISDDEETDIESFGEGSVSWEIGFDENMQFINRPKHLKEEQSITEEDAHDAYFASDVETKVFQVFFDFRTSADLLDDLRFSGLCIIQRDHTSPPGPGLASANRKTNNNG